MKERKQTLSNWVHKPTYITFKDTPLLEIDNTLLYIETKFNKTYERESIHSF